MQPKYVVMAIAVALIWGINFAVIKLALTDFPPLLLTALRFILASLPVIFLPRPQLHWREMGLISLFLFLGQYGFLFTGMPPGLASALLQMQAFLTILFAIPLLGEKPKPIQLVGSCIALIGLVCIALTITGNVTVLGFGLTMASATCFGLGNVLLRKSDGGGANMLSLICWMSLIPPVPLLILSYGIEGPDAILAALQFTRLTALTALLYIAFISTLLAFSMWGVLFKHYTAASIAPFALLVPIFGAVAASLIFDERFTGARLIGMILIVAGVAIAVVTSANPWKWRRQISTTT